ncbi:MAG: hypothetical protein CSB28_01930 [Desulfobacterales bacterium]|nr:MAG: hypothetical protein CSB28_01930 [Desulfobacterales bacterium]
MGENFDIHGGGQDLIFPHHENEIAQSEGCSGQPFANLWIHHGFVTIKDEKMSKSLGNFLTIRDIRKHYHHEILRFFVFSTHYRNPLDFSESAMQDAATGLERLYTVIAQCEAAITETTATKQAATVISEKDLLKLQGVEERFIKAMDNDFNTAQAQGIFFDTAKLISKILRDLPETAAAEDITALANCIRKVKELAAVMGILQEDANHWLAARKERLAAGLAISSAEIEEKIALRLQARKEKNWTESDRIRDELATFGVELKDDAAGTSWSVKKQS